MEKSRRLTWSREMASGEVSNGTWDELLAGTPRSAALVGVMVHPDLICRTAGYVTRMSGGVGGERSRGLPLSRFGTNNGGSILLKEEVLP